MFDYKQIHMYERMGEKNLISLFLVAQRIEKQKRHFLVISKCTPHTTYMGCTRVESSYRIINWKLQIWILKFPGYY